MQTATADNSSIVQTILIPFADMEKHEVATPKYACRIQPIED
jgi:hypothetical protein